MQQLLDRLLSGLSVYVYTYMYVYNVWYLHVWPSEYTSMLYMYMYVLYGTLYINPSKGPVHVGQIVSYEETYESVHSVCL